METLHSIVHIGCIIADLSIPVIIVVAIAAGSQNKRQRAHNPSQKKSNLPYLLIAGSILAAVLMNFLYFVIAVKKYGDSEKHMYEVPSFSVTSEDLHDGVWDTAIGKNSGNQSPQLSWDAVDGAAAYGIVMVDEDARNWMHWKTPSVMQAGIPAGYISADCYIGPYPPNGETHTYTVYVIALKQPKDGMTGMFDAPNDAADHDLKRSINSLDIIDDGKTGNILAIGTLSGTYTSK